LKQVLNLIKDMRKQEGDIPKKRITPPHINPDSTQIYIYYKANARDIDDSHLNSEDALKYVCWLVKADKLYDVALTTYDFDLVVLVAT